MKRRDLVTALIALGALPLAAMAQQAKKVPRLCFLTFDPGTLRANRYGAFFEGLRQLGYVDGQNIAIDYLSADGRGERIPAKAAECLRLNADIIVASTTPAAQAAKNATRTVPIVMLALGDPIGAGLVDSLARPGGNVTGMTFIAPALAAKRLELLKEMVPGISRVLVLTYGVDPISAPQIESMQSAARSLNVTLNVRNIRTADDIPAAFDSVAKDRIEGLVTTVESIFTVHRARLIDLAAKHRLPAVYGLSLAVPDGGLISYHADLPVLYAGAASYVDKLLKGAKAADLPVMQPTTFDLAINLKTAKALGLNVPPALILRANRVIE